MHPHLQLKTKIDQLLSTIHFHQPMLQSTGLLGVNTLQFDGYMKELHSHIGVNIIYQQLQAHVLYQYGSILFHMWLFGYRSFFLAVSRPRRQ